ncbi:PepSY domain-containing protein [Lentibacillus sp. Marseille-P4043]|uniref:PepSY domain-containing protein n=1 Tax=Lentibacillus sp. Marseille-P4043 TaxID=2040293 RepID=UPI00131A5352|nr:PepSY domain-containing protein [Lentibacillus sp. Marseille-P4043]
MKRKVALMIGIFVGACSLGFGIYHSNASQVEPELTMDDIKQLVKAQYPGTITELELDKENNKSVYEVEIAGDGKEYDLHLDGKTGEVVSLSKKMTLPENNNENEKQSNVNDKMKETAKDKKEDATSNKKQNTKSKPAIDSKKAVEIASNEFNGSVTDFELDEEDGRLIYEIEMHAINKEAEIEIDAYTGEIIVLSIDEDD